VVSPMFPVRCVTYLPGLYRGVTSNRPLERTGFAGRSTPIRWADQASVAER
jgi:hypothetical protein